MNPTENPKIQSQNDSLRTRSSLQMDFSSNRLLGKKRRSEIEASSDKSTKKKGGFMIRERQNIEDWWAKATRKKLEKKQRKMLEESNFKLKQNKEKSSNGLLEKTNLVGIKNSYKSKEALILNCVRKYSLEDFRVDSFPEAKKKEPVGFKSNDLGVSNGRSPEEFKKFELKGLHKNSILGKFSDYTRAKGLLENKDLNEIIENIHDLEKHSRHVNPEKSDRHERPLNRKHTQTQSKTLISAPGKTLNASSNSTLIRNSENKSKFYFSFAELLQFFKYAFDVDHETFILKDESKQEFKARANSFLEKYTICYDNQKVLIREDYMDEFFDLTKRFVNIQGFEKVDKLFNLFIEEFKVVQLQPRFEYVRPTAFLTEIPIKADDNKKRSYQFNKVKSTPKWMNYAWDILGLLIFSQINNSRKSFIFNRYSDEGKCNVKQTNKTRTNSEFDSVRDYYEQGEIHLDLNSKNDEGTDHRSKSSSIEKSEGFGIEIVHEKLRNKVYKAFSDFYDDIVKMLKCVEGYWARVKNKKNLAFCKNTYGRVHKLIDKLKLDNKI